MDDHRRGAIGYAPTVAMEPTGVPVAVPVSRTAQTELASGTNRTPGPTEQTGPVVGGVIGRYTVTTRVGSDPVGVVFGAQDEAGQRVAIKLVHVAVAHAAYRARLVRDGQALLALRHASLVEIRELGTAFGRPFVVMDFVDGPLLPKWLEERRGWHAIVEVFAQIGSALAAGHGAGFVHGDWTTDCVLVEPSGRPRVIDVGLGRFDPKGSSSVNPRLDQLRFAVALREALGGGSGGDRALWATVPEPVQAVVARAVDDGSPERYPALADVVTALDRARGRNSRKASGAAGGSRARTVAAIVAGGVLALGAAAMAYALMTRGERAAPPPPPPAPVPAGGERPAAAAGGERPAADGERPAAAAAVDGVPAAAAAAVDGVPPAAAAAVDGVPSTAAAAGVRPAAAADGKPRTAAAPANGTPHTAAADSAPQAVALVTSPAERRELIASAVHDLGFYGIDADTSQPTGSIAAGVTRVRDGLRARKAGDCAGAEAALSDAGLLLMKASDDRVEATMWQARAALGIGLCELAAGNYGRAAPLLKRAVSGLGDAERGQARLAEGLAEWELNDRTAGYMNILGANDPTSSAAFLRVFKPLGINDKTAAQ